MAIVPDLSGNAPACVSFPAGTPVDRDYALGSYNRTNAGTPNSVLTPLFVGEIVYDTTNNEYYRATTSANNTWTVCSIELT